jgi:hypothetical protein
MPQDFWSNAIYSLVPTIALGLIFWFVIRAILRSDRSERRAYAKVEAQERALASKNRASDSQRAPREPARLDSDASISTTPTPEA